MSTHYFKVLLAVENEFGEGMERVMKLEAKVKNQGRNFMFRKEK